MNVSRAFWEWKSLAATGCNVPREIQKGMVSGLTALRSSFEKSRLHRPTRVCLAASLQSSRNLGLELWERAAKVGVATDVRESGLISDDGEAGLS